MDGFGVDLLRIHMYIYIYICIYIDTQSAFPDPAIWVRFNLLRIYIYAYT